MYCNILCGFIDFVIFEIGVVFFFEFGVEYGIDEVLLLGVCLLDEMFVEFDVFILL